MNKIKKQLIFLAKIKTTKNDSLNCMLAVKKGSKLFDNVSKGAWLLCIDKRTSLSDLRFDKKIYDIIFNQLFNFLLTLGKTPIFRTKIIVLKHFGTHTRLTLAVSSIL